MGRRSRFLGLAAALVALLALLWFLLRSAPPVVGPGPAAAEPPPAPPPPAAVAAADGTGATAAPQRTALAAEDPAEDPTAGDAEAPPMLRGRVLDSRGQPMADVPIALRAFSYADRSFGQTFGSTARSGTDGRFALAIPDALPVRAPLVPVAEPPFDTLRASPRRAGQDDEDLLLVAAPAVALRGRVRGSDGSLLGDASVQVVTMFLAEFPLPLEHTIEAPHTPATSAADGTFALDAVPLAAGVHLLVARTGYAPARVPSLDAASGFLDVTLQKLAAAPGRLTGVVLDPAGQPVPGAELLLGYDQLTRSRADGSFELEYLPRPSRLFAMKPGFLPIVLQDVGERTPLPLVLTFAGPALAIEGRVVDAAGGPQAGWLINLVDPEPAGMRLMVERASTPGADALPDGALARTGPDGAFTLMGLSDREYRLRAWDPATALSVQGEPVRAGSRGVELRVPADAFALDVPGTVVDRAGRAVEGATISVHLLAATHGGVVIVPGPTTRTDADGRFTLPRVPARHVELAVLGEDLVYQKHAIEDLMQQTPLRLTVARRCHVQLRGEIGLEVRFLDADGKALILESRSQGAGFATNAWTMRGETSPVLAIPETAETMVWSRDGKEVGRQPVRLEPAAEPVAPLQIGTR